MEFEEKLAEISKKYTVALREGRVDDASSLASKSSRLKKRYGEGDDVPENFEEIDVDDEDSEDPDVEFDDEETERDVDFERLNGIGEEIADVLRSEFDSVVEFLDSEVEDVLHISGIGKKRAEKLLGEN